MVNKFFVFRLIFEDDLVSSLIKILSPNFNKDSLKIPQEIIISTLEKHQRYFPIFDNRDRLTNYFFVVANKKDKKKYSNKKNFILSFKPL